MVEELGWYTKVQKKDYAGAVTSLKAAVDSGFVPEADLPRRYKALAQLSYELKDFPKAVEYGKKAIELAPGSNDAIMIVAHSLYLSDDFAGARAFIDSQTASATTKPDEQLLLIGLRSNYELNDRPGTMRALEMLIRNYPAQKYWTDLLNNQLYETKTDRDLRALYRLMSDTNNSGDSVTIPTAIRSVYSSGEYMTCRLPSGWMWANSRPRAIISGWARDRSSRSHRARAPGTEITVGRFWTSGSE